MLRRIFPGPQQRTAKADTLKAIPFLDYSGGGGTGSIVGRKARRNDGDKDDTKRAVSPAPVAVAAGKKRRWGRGAGCTGACMPPLRSGLISENTPDSLPVNPIRL